jgi:hypothetical protein
LFGAREKRERERSFIDNQEVTEEWLNARRESGSMPVESG